MGYTTTFDGSISVEPPMTPELVEKFNKFCSERHEKPTDPSIWCDWEAAPDGTKVYWNGSEKSYNMDSWLRFMVTDFFLPAGYTLNGEMIAWGEEPGDVWKLEVTNNLVTRLNSNLRFS